MAALNIIFQPFGIISYGKCQIVDNKPYIKAADDSLYIMYIQFP